MVDLVAARQAAARSLAGLNEKLAGVANDARVLRLGPSPETQPPIASLPYEPDHQAEIWAGILSARIPALREIGYRSWGGQDAGEGRLPAA